MLIAFCSNGHGAGKDEAAEFVREWCEERGSFYQRLAFGDKMKLLVAETLGIRSIGNLPETDQDVIARVDAFKAYGRVDVDADERELGPEFFDSIRGWEFIINLAGDGPNSGARRVFGADFWVKQVLPDNWQNPADVTCITDLRFPEEAMAINKHSPSYIIKINRPGAEEGRSENQLDSKWVDYRIDNDEDLDKLKQRVWWLMDHLWVGDVVGVIP